MTTATRAASHALRVASIVPRRLPKILLVILCRARVLSASQGVFGGIFLVAGASVLSDAAVLA